MILDETLEFADAVSVAAAASTALIGDVVDLGATVKDFGMGQPVWVVITTDTEVITAGSAGTIQFFVVSDSLATLGAGVVASCTTHLSSPAYVTDDSAANSDQLNAGGLILAAQLPHGDYERYLGILCTIGTTEVTAGAINAYLTTEEPARVLEYPNAANQ